MPAPAASSSSMFTSISTHAEIQCSARWIFNMISNAPAATLLGGSLLRAAEGQHAIASQLEQGGEGSQCACSTRGAALLLSSTAGVGPESFRCGSRWWLVQHGAVWHGVCHGLRDCLHPRRVEDNSAEACCNTAFLGEERGGVHWSSISGDRVCGGKEISTGLSLFDGRYEISRGVVKGGRCAEPQSLLNQQLSS